MAKAELMVAFEKDFEHAISIGMEPSCALENTKGLHPKVKDKWAEDFYSKWLEELRVKNEVIDQNIMASEVTPEEIRAIYESMADNVNDVQFDIGTAIHLMRDGRDITNTKWERSDNYPRLTIDEVNGELAILKIGCPGGVPRRYTPTDSDLLNSNWIVA